MKIRVGELRQLIREVALSPSLKNNKPIDNVFDSKNVPDLVQRLVNAFENSLSLDLVVRALDDHYNPETREFDDEVYNKIKEIVAGAREKASAVVQRGLNSAWEAAHAAGSAADGPQSGVRNKQAA